MDHLFTKEQCKIYLAQIERRAKFRQEFLKLRTDPSMHAKEAGFVFDSAHQRYQAMKAYQFDYFKPTFPLVVKGIATILPFFAYGALIYTSRSETEANIRSGKLRYRDRIFRLQ